MRRLCMALLVLALLALVCFGATQSLRNSSGKPARAVTITFSEKVSITSYDQSVFPHQDPTGRAQTFTFSGGQLANGASLRVSWTPSSATVEDSEWLTKSPGLSGPLEPTIETTEYRLAGDPATAGTLQGTITRTIERGVLPFKVTFVAALEGIPVGATLSWDTDIYVDANRDGDTENDVDAVGASLDLLYTENYNPTVKFVVKTASGEEVGTWKNMVRNDFTAGTGVVLDGEALLALSGTEASGLQWQQRHMEQNSFEYMTEYVADPQASSSLVTQCAPLYAGKYVYALGSGGGAPLVSAWVIEPAGACRHITLTMADVWNDPTDTQGNLIDIGGTWFTDDQARQILRYFAEEGFDSIQVPASLALHKVLPTPLMSLAGGGPSATDLRWILPLIGAPSLLTGPSVAGLPDDEIEAFADYRALPHLWYESFFALLREKLLDLATLGKEYGLDAFGIGGNYLWDLGSIGYANPREARWVVQQWIDIVRAVRETSGARVGLELPGPGTSVAAPLRGVPDFSRFLMGGYGFYGDASWIPRVAATTTAEELRTTLVGFYRATVQQSVDVLGVPVSFPLSAASFIGAARRYDFSDAEQMTYDAWREEFRRGGYGDQTLNGDALGSIQPSFRDQTLLLETFIPALVSMASVAEIALWGQYWWLSDYTDFAPQNVLQFAAVNSAALQGKPGLQVAKLWESILSPNERNSYRHVRPLPATNIAGRLPILPEFPAPPTASLPAMVVSADPHASWDSLPTLFAWESIAGVTYGTVDLQTNRYTSAPNADERFGGVGLHVADIRAANVDGALAIRIDFESLDSPNPDSRVDYVLALGACRVQVRGGNQVGLSGPGNTLWWTASSDYLTLGKHAIELFIPASIVERVLLPLASMVPCSAGFHIAFRGESTHAFAHYPGEALFGNGTTTPGMAASAGTAAGAEP